MPISKKTSYTIIQYGRTAGVRSIYSNSAIIEAPTKDVYAHLINRLCKRGAQIHAADKASGIVSWFDPGAVFVSLPGQLKKKKIMYKSILSPSMGDWRGMVYGTARIKPFKEKSWINLRICGRNIGERNEVLSEGTYERTLLDEISEGIQKRSSISPMCLIKTIRKNDRKNTNKHVTYDYLLATQFRTLHKVCMEDLRHKGLSKVYPVKFEDLWSACLDITSQCTAIIDVSRSNGQIVFFHQISLPEKIRADKIQTIDVMLALNVQARGEHGSSVHIALLSEPGLTASPIPDLSQDDLDILGKRLKGEPKKVAAAIVTQQLLGQLATQLFYRERWEKKLRYRHGNQNKETPTL